MSESDKEKNELANKELANKEINSIPECKNQDVKDITKYEEEEKKRKTYNNNICEIYSNNNNTNRSDCKKLYTTTNTSGNIPLDNYDRKIFICRGKKGFREKGCRPDKEMFTEGIYNIYNKSEEDKGALECLKKIVANQSAPPTSAQPTQTSQIEDILDSAIKMDPTQRDAFINTALTPSPPASPPASPAAAASQEELAAKTARQRQIDKDEKANEGSVPPGSNIYDQSDLSVRPESTLELSEYPSQGGKKSKKRKSKKRKSKKRKSKKRKSKKRKSKKRKSKKR